MTSPKSLTGSTLEALGKSQLGVVLSANAYDHDELLATATEMIWMITGSMRNHQGKKRATESYKNTNNKAMSCGLWQVYSICP